MIQRIGLGIGCALVAAAVYGLMPNLTRVAYNNGVPAIESVFFRTSLIALAFAILAVLRGESMHVPRAARMPFSVLSLATGGVSVCYLASVQFIPVGLAAIVFYTFPVLILLLAPMVERRRPSFFELAIAGCAFIGLAIALAPSLDSLDWRGLILSAMASISAAMQFFSGRTISRHMAPAAFGARVHLAIWPMTLLLVLYFGHGDIVFFPGGPVTSAGYAALSGIGVFYVVAYFVHMLSLRYAPASRVAPFYNLEPVMTTIVAATILGERLAINQYAGGAIVLAALIAASLRDGRRKA